MSDAARHIPAGTVLFRAGDPCRGFMLLHSGVLRVTLTAANGREVVLYRVVPGEVCLQTFSCLVARRDYAARGVAETDLLAEIIPSADFHRALIADSTFRERVFTAVARRFADFERLVEDVALTGFPARLARVLLRLAGGGDIVHATHDQLAGETASGRAVVSRQLGRFADDGLVQLQRGAITLSDRPALVRLARSG